jgi:hypothetical protein
MQDAVVEQWAQRFNEGNAEAIAATPFAGHGEVSIFPARYSFLLVKHNSAWLIAHRHSSMLPKPDG